MTTVLRDATTPTPAADEAAGGRIARALATLRRIIGVPDYETYRTHMAACHPDQPLLTEDEFAEERLTAKYSKPGQRCC